MPMYEIERKLYNLSKFESKTRNFTIKFTQMVRSNFDLLFENFNNCRAHDLDNDMMSAYDCESKPHAVGLTL